MSKILLIKPPFNRHIFVRRFARCEPYEFAFLATGLKNESVVAVIDMRVDNRDIRKIVEDEKPTIVGFTALTMDVNTVRQLAREVKAISPEIVTCVGGEHATFLPNDFLPDVDFVFTHASIATFKKFVADISAGRRPTNAVISGAPAHTEVSISPDRGAYQRYFKKYVFGPAQPVSLLHTSSGCPSNCNFCSIITKDPKYRTADIDSTLKNLSECPGDDVLSIDAHALANIRQSKLLYREIASARLPKRLMISTRSDTLIESPHIVPLLREANVSVVSMGLEAVDDVRLEEHNKEARVDDGFGAVKILKDHGILVRANFIISPDFTRSDFDRLTSAISEMQIDFPVFQILTPLPGTPLYLEYESKFVTQDYDFFDLSHSVVATSMEFREFHEEFRRLFRANYSLKHMWALARKMPLTHTARGALIAALSFSEMRYSKNTLYA